MWNLSYKTKKKTFGYGRRNSAFGRPLFEKLFESCRSHFQPRLTRLFLILSQGCHQFSYHFISKFTISSTKKFVLIVLLIHKIPRFKIGCISSFWQNCKDLGCLKNCLVSITLLVFFYDIFISEQVFILRFCQ